jgi:hypothetical protein
MAKRGVSAPSSQDPFFGVYDRNGWCIAMGKSSDQAVETARHCLGLSTAREVINRCSVVRINRATYEQLR